jgi:lipoprotein-anchoring transpeptidase ErfK/SrfK
VGARRLAYLSGVIVAVVTAAAITGCGATERRAAPVPSRPPAATADEPASSPSPSPTPVSGPLCLDHGEVEALGDDALTYAAVARRPTEARRAPAGRSFASFGLANENGHATVFAIQGAVKDGCGRLWYAVALPVRPNGTTGYVAARDVGVLEVRTRIVVDLSERHLTYFKDGEPTFEATVGIGAPSTPTPTGRYYVNQRLFASDPSGPWGPAAIGISAFSDVLQDWSQGGPIAIHGTNEPESIGEAVSHGCIRLPNATLLKLFATTPAGTPVIIHP